MSAILLAILSAACGATTPSAPPRPDSVSSPTASQPPRRAADRSSWHVEAVTGMGTSGTIEAWVADGHSVVMFLGADGGSGLQLARADSEWSPQTVLMGLPRFRTSRIDGRVSIGGSIGAVTTGPDSVFAFGTLGATSVENVTRIETDQRWASYGPFGFAADAAGSVHVCFNAEVQLTATSSAPGGLFYTTNRGGAWSTVAIDEHGDDCEVAVDARGTVHLVYTVTANDRVTSLRYSRRTSAGSEGLEIAPRAYGARLRAESDGRVRIVYALARGESATLESATIDGREIRDRVTADFLLGTWPSSSFAATWDAAGAPHVIVRTGAREPFALAYATIRDGAWTLEAIFAPSSATPDRALAIALLPSGEPLVAFRHEESFVLVAERLAAAACPPGQERIDATCCWPGQEARAGRCVGRPSCPTGFAETGDGCEALDPTVRWALRACARASLHARSAEAYQGCRILGENDGGASTVLEARCASGDGASCVVLDNIRRGVTTYEVALHAECRGSACSPAYRTTRVRSRTSSDEEDERGRERLARACELGHAEACELHAIEVAGGSREQRFEDACRNGSPQACAHVAYEHRRASSSDPFTRAVATLTAACEANDRAACANLGVLRALALVPGANARSAADVLVRGCGELDYPPDPEVEGDLGEVLLPEERRHACTELVLFAARSNAVPRQTWRRSAAASVLTSECGGSAMACAALAEMYRRGFGVRASPARARELIEEACSVGDQLGELPFECPAEEE